MVAFVVSLVIGTLILVVPFRWALKNRPVGRHLTWGEAMVASVWSFFLMFWFYGVVPHQWLAWADNELNWRGDKILHGPRIEPIFNVPQGGGIFDTILPFDLSYLIVRDLLAVVLYLALLGLNTQLWMMWQKRGQKKASTGVARSEYGRPLVKA